MNKQPILNNNDSDSEGSYEIVDYDNFTTKGQESIEETTEKLKSLNIAKKDELEEENKVKPTPEPKKPVKAETVEIEGETNTKQVEGKINAKKEDTKEKVKPDFKSLKQRCFHFLKEVDSADLKTVYIVAKTLIEQNDSNLETALLTALSTVDRIYNHELIQDLIPLLPVYAKKIEGWLPVLMQLDFEMILAMLPKLAKCAENSKCGEKTVVDMRPFFSLMCPQKIAELEKKIPANQERTFDVDPKNMSGVFGQAEKSLNKEFPDKVVHSGFVCDLCDMNPIVGVRYKCAVRPNFDLCQKCVAKQPSNYPCIRIATPTNSETPRLAGLHEFVGQTRRSRGLAHGRGHHGPWGGRRRGGCPWREWKRCGRGDPTTSFFGAEQQKSEETKTGCKRKSEEVERKKEEWKRMKKEKKDEWKRMKKEKKAEWKLLKQEKRKIKDEMKELKKVVIVVAGGEVKLSVNSKKTIKVTLKNQGNYTKSFFNGVKAVFCKGHKDLVAKESIEIPFQCEPGKTVEVPISFVAPETTGEYAVYWAVCDGKRKLGKFHVTVQVVESKEEEQNDKEENKKVQKTFKYSSELGQLINMGYPDSEMLRAILIANDGSVSRVVELLLDTDLDMNDIYPSEDENEDVDEMRIEDGSEEDLVKEDEEKKNKQVEKKEEAKFNYPESLKQLTTLGFPDSEMLRAVIVVNKGDVHRCVQDLLQ